MEVSNGVFERKGSDEVSDSSFYLVLMLCLVWGFGMTALMSHLAIASHYVPDVLGFILFGLVLPIAGIFLSLGSDVPIVSFLGYNMVCLPLGYLLGPCLTIYSPGVVMNALALTGAITFVMGAAGVVYPETFKDMGAPLLLALSSLILVRVAQIFIPALAALTIIDYIAAGIFSLYVAYDMYRASVIPKTIDNAIDVSVSLYLDILNLFLTILKIMGESKK